jgi:nucleotide-binding universal stress UspA family protein
VNAVLIALVIVLALAVVALLVLHFSYRRLRPSRVPNASTRRILFPFVADALSPRALDAALRLANAEEATLVPVFLARVSLQLPIDTPLPRQSAICMPLQEAIEQRAAAFGVPVDARVERGRSYRQALRETIDNERFDRIVIAATPRGSAGFDPDDVAWLLENAPGEVVVLRPGAEDKLGPPTAKGRRRTRMTRPAPGPKAPAKVGR